MTIGERARRIGAGAVAAVCAVLATSAVAVAAPPPGAEFGITSFTTSVVDINGDEETRAGAHPFQATAQFSFDRYDSEALGRPVPVEQPRTIRTELPPGFSGNPQTAPTCPLPLVASDFVNPSRCPLDTAVGYVRVEGATKVPSPVFNVVPERGYPAEFAFSAANFTFTVYPEVRSDSDYGVTMVVPATAVNQITDVELTFCSYGMTSTGPVTDPTFACKAPGDPGASVKPFLTNPATECSALQPTTKLMVDSWEHPGAWKTKQFPSPTISDCDKLTFDPSVDVEPSTNAPDSPTGLEVGLNFPQDDNAEGLAPPALKKAVVTLPEGMTINPSGAGGLEACPDVDLKLRSKDPVRCPDASKVGTVTARSPLLAEELSGGVYIRSQNSFDPESGEMFRIALVLESEERGLSVRLPGSIRANKDTGRIETTFDNNPELPVSDIDLTFKDGPRAPLASPPTCGEKTVDVAMTSWGGKTANRRSSFNVDCQPDLGIFAPAFQAGTISPIAGGSSPFALRIDRPDGNDVLDGLTLAMPEGLLATLKGNVGTQVGKVDVAAGPGSQPYWLPGRVFLEGAYDDAPYSLRVVVPAKAGPFDLGEVVVRQKIYVDPHDAHVTVVSDPVPTVVKGVPVRLRTMDVAIDKPGFMSNPTSCDEKAITATLKAAGGATAAVSSRFQVSGCQDLPLKPQIDLALVGAKETKDGGHPGLSATVRQTAGQAGLKKVEVILPPTLALVADNAQALCKPEQAAAKSCPAGSIVGRAKAVTPLLDEPLTGNVYFVEGLRTGASGKSIKTLPKLWVALRGAVALDVWADTSVTQGKNQRLINTFPFVPDAPIESFQLEIDGGKNGILAVSSKDGKADVCKSAQVASTEFSGQNGKRIISTAHLVTPCGFGVVATSLSGTRLKATVGGLGSGKLTVSGNGIRTATRSVWKSSVATVTAKLTASGKRSYAKRQPVKVRVMFAPSAKGAKPQVRTVKVKRAAAKKAKKAASKSSSKKQ